MALLLEFDNFDSFVLESTLESGIRIIPYSNWLQINEECYKILCPKERDPAEVISLIKTYWGKKYDWPGIMYFIPCFIGHFLFGIDFPKENAWQSDNKYFCNELGGKLAGYPQYSMVTPAKMCSDFLKMVGQNG